MKIAAFFAELDTKAAVSFIVNVEAVRDAPPPEAVAVDAVFNATKAPPVRTTADEETPQMAPPPPDPALLLRSIAEPDTTSDEADK